VSWLPMPSHGRVRVQGPNAQAGPPQRLARSPSCTAALALDHDVRDRASSRDGIEPHPLAARACPRCAYHARESRLYVRWGKPQQGAQAESLHEISLPLAPWSFALISCHLGSYSAQSSPTRERVLQTDTPGNEEEITWNSARLAEETPLGRLGCEESSNLQRSLKARFVLHSLRRSARRLSGHRLKVSADQRLPRAKGRYD
jgi:hypothetical protein